MNKILAAYLLLINLAAFLIYGLDKRRAVRHRFRIPEAHLLAAAALGGSVGALCGMRVFHHKTRHAKFTVGVPLILALQIAAALWLFGRYFCR